MNHFRKKAAMAKLDENVAKGMSKVEAVELLKTDEAAYTAEEIGEISEAAGIEDGNTNPPPPPVITPGDDKKDIPQGPGNPSPVVIDGKPDLSEFDYKNLTGKSFRKYVELVGDRSYHEIDEETGAEKEVTAKLRDNDHYVFELYSVDVVMKVRFPGVKDSPNDFNGVKVKNDKPIHQTNIPVHMALEYNRQILNAHSRAGHGRYYLLKK